MLRKQIANTSESGKAQRGSTSTVQNEPRSFSVRCLVSLTYKEGLISGVNIPVVVPQSIGISLRNRIGDSTGEFLVIVLLGFLLAFNVLELLLFLYFWVRSGGMFAW